MAGVTITAADVRSLVALRDEFLSKRASVIARLEGELEAAEARATELRDLLDQARSKDARSIPPPAPESGSLLVDDGSQESDDEPDEEESADDDETAPARRPVRPASGDTLPGAILAFVAANPGSTKRAIIEGVLAARPSTPRNHTYPCIDRLVREGRIRKDADVFFDPAHRAPAPHANGAPPSSLKDKAASWSARLDAIEPKRTVDDIKAAQHRLLDRAKGR